MPIYNKSHCSGLVSQSWISSAILFMVKYFARVTNISNAFVLSHGEEIDISLRE